MKNLRSMVLALASAFPALASGPVAPPTADAQDVRAVREIEIAVGTGYSPNRITLAAGERVRLRFVRHTSAGCTGEVVFPWAGIRRALPPHEPVIVELPPMEAGEYDFHCGMDMVHGTLVVEAR